MFDQRLTTSQPVGDRRGPGGHFSSLVSSFSPVLYYQILRGSPVTAAATPGPDLTPAVRAAAA
eukprot:758332-Hanusia_phi.AAC.2